MNGVTIDKLDLKSHRRYAEDQIKLDTKYTQESPLIPPHSEILGTSSIYSSSWEDLFETQKKNIPWACFIPPPLYTVQTNRFFTFRVVPSISLGDEEEEEAQKEKEREEEERQKKENSLFKKTMEAEKGLEDTLSRFEGDKGSILNLLTSIQSLNSLLAQINGRKLQYQKG